MQPGDEPAVRDLMVPSSVTVTAATGVGEAVRLMARQNIGAVVVVDGGRPVGIFTERDLLRRTAELEGAWLAAPVGEFMSSALLTAEAGECWSRALERMCRHGIRHLPVVEAGGLVGMLSMRDMQQHRAAALQALVDARTAELAARNRELSERDRERSHHLRVASELQRSIFPRQLPDFAPFAVAAHFQPQDEVSGDYFDLIRHDDDVLGLLIADVSGHSVPAALVTVMAKTCYTAYCQELSAPAEVLRRLNHSLDGLLPEQFLTMAVARLDRRSLEMVHARAGHPPALLHRCGAADVVRLEPRGMALGVHDGAEFAEERLALRPGDVVLFYTDGLTETRDAAGRLLGEEAVHRALSEHGELGAQALIERLLALAAAHRGGAPPEDDLTMVVFEVTGR